MKLRSTALSLTLTAICLMDLHPGTTAVGADPKPAITQTEERKLSRRERKDRLQKLAERYHEFLTEVEPIITPEELDAFLFLETDAQRDYFIERFWLIRDTDPSTPRNEYREAYADRVAEAKARFTRLTSDRSRIYLRHGAPTEMADVDCPRWVVPIQVWGYPYIDELGADILMVFYRPNSGGDYRLWQPQSMKLEMFLQQLVAEDGEGDPFSQNHDNPLLWECPPHGAFLVRAIQRSIVKEVRLLTVFEPPEIDPEHVGRTLRNMVVSNPDAPKLAAVLEVSYPGKQGTRTVVRLSMAIPRGELVSKDLDGTRFYNVDVTGEILRDGAHFDNYRYRFNFPAETVGVTVPVIVDRFLRPNDYLSRIKVVDANSGAEAVLEREIEVPWVEASPELIAGRLEIPGTLESVRHEDPSSDAEVDLLGSVRADPVATDPRPSSSKAEERKLSRRERKDRLQKLAGRYHEFLTEVEPIITPEELDAFLLLETDAQRDYFIERFWLIRDTDPSTPRNEYREQYAENFRVAKEKFKYLTSDQARTYLRHGAPAEVAEIDCPKWLVPIEIWTYPYLEGLRHQPLPIFYRSKWTNEVRLWQPWTELWHPYRELRNKALEELVSQNGLNEISLGGQRNSVGQSLSLETLFFNLYESPLAWECAPHGELLMRAVSWSLSKELALQKLFEPPEIDPEHVGRTLRNTVVANPNAPKLPAELEISYPGKRGTRTAVRLSMMIPRSELVAKDLDGTRFYNLDVTGEILQDGTWFDNYRYRFNFPAEIVGETVPVIIDRFLRPNRYLSRIKLIDANSGAEVVIEREIEVPFVEDGPELTAARREASEKIDSLRHDYFFGEARLTIIPLPQGPLTGPQTIETLVTGDQIARVEFQLDGRTIMTKRSPPYSLQLDLGIVPAMRTVRAIGFDGDGKVVAGDEIVINTGADPFRIRIAYPRIKPKVEGRTRIEIDLDLPEGETLERIDLYLNEDLVGSLYDEPYTQTILVPPDLVYLRAVATTTGDDPRTAEDVVLLNSPQFLQEVEVRLIELPTTVLRDGRPVQDLPRSAFRVFDAGQEVEIAKFEKVRDLPLRLGLAIDSSGSMQDRMTRAQRAAAQFFRGVLREGDRAFVIAFADVPMVVQEWTTDQKTLVEGLAGLRAEDATALYDSIVYSLYHFQGVDGQKALVVLSDGKDTSSKFTYEQTLEYARRAAVPIYSIGIAIPAFELDTRMQLGRISRETGARSYFIDDVGSLDAIYAEIETELRAQYLLGFYPPEKAGPRAEWREIEVRVEGAEARTIRGYYR